MGFGNIRTPLCMVICERYESFHPNLFRRGAFINIGRRISRLASNLKMVLVEYYGPSTSFTVGAKSETVDNVQCLDDLFQHWDRNFKGLSEYVRQSCGLTVNLEYIDIELKDQIILDKNDEVAIIPPVSSG